MTVRTRTAALTLLIAVVSQSAPAADLAPGKPPLTDDLADRKRDAVEEVFGFQMTARQLAEHRRLYARCWTYAPAGWQASAGTRIVPRDIDAHRHIAERFRTFLPDACFDDIRF